MSRGFKFVVIDIEVPCLTLRDNTERPETITLGTNELVGTDPENLKPYLEKLLKGDWKEGGEILCGMVKLPREL